MRAVKLRWIIRIGIGGSCGRGVCVGRGVVGLVVAVVLGVGMGVDLFSWVVGVSLYILNAI